jgi:hypothetical protein
VSLILMENICEKLFVVKVRRVEKTENARRVRSERLFA